MSSRLLRLHATVAAVVAKLCAERPCILEQRPDAPYSYVFGAVCALLTLLAQPRRRFEGEDADVGCVKSRVSSAEYASYLAFFPDVLALPSTLAELFMTTLRPTIAEDSSEWSTKTITYKGDDGVVQVLNPDTPPTPAFALDFERECGAIREAISKQGQAPLDAIRDGGGEADGVVGLLLPHPLHDGGEHVVHLRVLEVLVLHLLARRRLRRRARRLRSAGPCRSGSGAGRRGAWQRRQL